MRMMKVIKGLLSGVVVYMMLTGAAFAQAIPTSKLVWDQPAPDLATAQAYSYKYYPDGAATGIVIAPPITCALSGPVITCQTAFPAFTPGAHSLTLTATNAAGEGPKSAPLNFTFVVIPAAPVNPRIG
jgi:hypothetical protein